MIVRFIKAGEEDKGRHVWFLAIDCMTTIQGFRDAMKDKHICIPSDFIDEVWIYE